MHPAPYMILCTLLLATACQRKDQYKALDAYLPTTTPQVFSPDIISLPNRFEQYNCFSPNGTELYLSLTDADWNYSGIFHTSYQGGHWTPLDTSAVTKNQQDGGEPVIYQNALYFVSIRHHENPWHTDIYKAERQGTTWAEPIRLTGGINSSANEWHPSFTNTGTVYFSSERGEERYQADIYKANPSPSTPNHYQEAIKLPDGINTPYNDCDPLIAPDESFLIFHSNRPGGYGEHDLYITFKTQENTWTPPKNMGPQINTAEWEIGPALSPDGEYLFFTRRAAFHTTKPSNLYWVSTTVITALKE